MSTTLTKAEMAQMLCSELGVNKREARQIVEAFFELIRSALGSGDTVKLSGFGNFNLRNKSPRPGRNPKTGQEIPITARRVVTFKLGQQLKRRVDTYAGAVTE
ncbi:MAG: integration host factor subunit alpha [Immundisolibacter sp.]|uniref:integration host factor subunit alpha n=1 Tax=Immundisolibacter sp. TaxID=1934948 RepID=UPI00356A9B3E